MSIDTGARHRRQARGATAETRRRLTVLYAGSVIPLVGAGAPWALDQVRGHGPATQTVAARPSVAVLMPAAAPVPSASPKLVTAFDQFSAGTAAQIGLAFAAVDNPRSVTTLGAWSTGPAWSTIKVPLSIALMRQEARTQPGSAIRSAITESDNAAAEQIWEALGAHREAAAKVESVLSDAGQPVPQVTSEVTRPGFSAFGQTQWSLAGQARFLAAAACDPRDGPVLNMMGDVIAAQRWGLGTIGGARFKGGWGPDPDGLYLVRQYGLIPTPHGQLAVAVAAVAYSGGMSDGTNVLSRLAAWLHGRLDQLGGGRCR